MNPEKPLEIDHVPGPLHTLFDGLLPLVGKAEDRERNFLSRAVAAYTVHKLAGASVADAAASVVDGGDDGGLDAIWFNPNSNTLWLVQAKFISNGRGEPSLGDVAKFKLGIENLLQCNFDAFAGNDKIMRRQQALRTQLSDNETQVRAVLAYSGNVYVAEDRRRLFEDLKRRFSADSEFFAWKVCNLTTIHDWITGADQAPGVDQVTLDICRPGWIAQPHQTVYGLLRLRDAAQLYQSHGPRLLAANIRTYKGETEVNRQIADAVREEPSLFFYLNNGLVAYCQRLTRIPRQRADLELNTVTAYGFSVVNGAQTLGAIGKALPDPANATAEGHVFIRIVSLEDHDDERTFAGRMTRATNFQNRIGIRDFVAIDAEQERIAVSLKPSHITYRFKDGSEARKTGAKSFTLEEATSACACLAQQPECDLVTRAFADRRSLWSFEQMGTGAQVQPSRYEQVFRSERSARTIWRAVQAMREVLKAMQAGARTETGPRKSFFQNCRALVLNIVYLRLHPEQGDALALTSAEKAEVRRSAQEYAEVLWTVCESKGFVSRRVVADGRPEIFELLRDFRSVFESQADCRTLRGGLLAALNSVRTRGGH